MYIEDEGGRRYLDFGSGIGVNSTGHCHPKVVDAVREQVGKLIHGQYTTVKYPALLELTERLGAKMPGDIDSMFYASAGTEAVEAAVRLARQATRRPNIIAFQGSFHGRTAGALSMTTSKVGLRAGLQPLMGGVVVAPFPNAYRYGWDEDATTDFCLRELDQILETYSAPEETAAFFIEPIQGDGGYVPAGRRFLEGLRQRADHHGMLLAFDEVQAGFGRSGKFWSHEHFEVQPDILVTAKGLASGFPLSGFGASAALMERGWPGSQGGTYGGNPVSCVAAIATLEVIESEGLVENAARRGSEMGERLAAVAEKSPWVDDVRGIGLMMGTVIVDDQGQPDGDRAAEFLRRAEARGLLLLRCGSHGHIIRWLPPLIVTEAQVEEAVSIFGDCLSD